MDKRLIEIECCFCGHTWHVDLDHLDPVEQVIYRGHPDYTRYRVSCPKCGTHNVFDVPRKERE